MLGSNGKMTRGTLIGTRGEGGINAGKVGGIPFSHDRDLSQKLQRFMKGQEVTA